MPDSFQIVQLEASNVKNLRAIRITPDGKPVILTGKNGAGKSAVLDCILLGLTNTGPEDPIRHGANKAEILIDLGPYKIVRAFTRRGAYLDVIDADGNKVKSPQKFLDQFYGELTFDPLRFATMKAAEQREEIMRCAGLNLADLDAKRSAAFTERTNVNRDLERSKGHLASLPAVPDGTPDAAVSVAALAEKLNAAQEHNRQISVETAMAGELKLNIEWSENETLKLERQFEEIRVMLVNQRARTAELRAQQEAQLAKLRELKPVDTAALKSHIAEADIINRNVRAKEDLRLAKIPVAQLTAKAEILTKQITQTDAEKARRIAAAKYPVPGLAVDDAAVLWNAIPLQQLSTAEKIKVSAAISMAQNTKLRVMLVREGSLLDDDGLKALCELAAQQKCQVWLEKVSSTGGPGTIHIEDGEIAAIDGKPVAPQTSDAPAAPDNSPLLFQDK